MTVGEEESGSGLTARARTLRAVTALGVVGLVVLVWLMVSGAAADPETQRLRALPFQELVGEAQVIPYDDLYDRSESYEGALVFYEARLREVEADGTVMRAQVTPPHAGHPRWEDEMVIRYDGDEQFMSRDIIAFVGLSQGLQEYKRLMGGSDWLPTADVIQARYLRKDDAPR